jgi:hypothetical protein
MGKPSPKVLKVFPYAPSGKVAGTYIEGTNPSSIVSLSIKKDSLPEKEGN